MAMREKKSKKASGMVIVAEYRPWSGLSADILGLFLERLPQLRDWIRFGAVCRSWRRAERQRQPPRQLPCLAVLAGSWVDINISDGTLYSLRLPPNISGARCCGATEDWLVVSHLEHGSFLLNPFSKTNIPLPRRTTILQENNVRDGPGFITGRHLHDDWHCLPGFIRKAILSESPASDHCHLAALCNHYYLLVCRPRGETCTVLFDKNYSLEDIVFYKGKLLGVDSEETLFVFDMGDGQVTGVDIRREIPRRDGVHDEQLMFGRNKRVYLIESSGKLLMVVRFWLVYDANGSRCNRTVKFRVFELVEGSPPQWIDTNNLGGDVLYLGAGCSISVPSAEYKGFKGDVIYFTDDHFQLLAEMPSLRLDSGLYTMEDRSIQPFFPAFTNSPPTWLSLPSAR